MKTPGAWTPGASRASFKRRFRGAASGSPIVMMVAAVVTPMMAVAPIAVTPTVVEPELMAAMAMTMAPTAAVEPDAIDEDAAVVPAIVVPAIVVPIVAAVWVVPATVGVTGRVITAVITGARSNLYTNADASLGRLAGEERTAGQHERGGNT